MFPSRRLAPVLLALSLSAGAPGLQAQPDLRATSFTAPAFISPDQSIRVVFSLLNRFANVPSVTVGIYLSRDNRITATDRLLDSLRLSNFCSVCALTNRAMQIKIPHDIPGGNCFLGMLIDPANRVRERNETNNAMASSTRCFGGPDLRPTRIGLANLTFGSGDTLRVLVGIQNIGGENAPASLYGVYLSSDQTITTTDRLLLSGTTPILRPKGNAVGFHSVRIPEGIRVGTCYLGVIADRGRRVGEINERNNTTALRTTCVLKAPDLIVAAVTTAPNQIAGQRTRVSVSVRNIGNRPAGASTAGVFLSADRTVTTDDVFLGEVKFPAVSAGQTRSFANLLIPSFTAAGPCYIGAIADYRDQILERNEKNNLRVRTTTCTAYSGTGRRLEFVPRLGTPARSTQLADFRLVKGPRRAALAVTAPALPNHYYVLVLSASPFPKFTFDALSRFSMNNLNGPIFRNWFGRLDTRGRSTAPGFDLPALAGVSLLRVHTHTMFFTPAFGLVGAGSNSVASDIRS